MKRKLALTVGVLAVVALSGCSATGDAAPTREEACSSLSEGFGAVMTSMELGMAAGSKEAMEVHLAGIENALEESAEVDGPDDFIPLRDALLADTQRFVDEGRKAMQGSESQIDAEQARMLESYAALDRFCAN